MSGKSTATSSMFIGLPVLQAHAAAAAHAGADAAVAGVEEDRQFRLGEHFVDRVGDAIVRERTAGAADAASARGRRRSRRGVWLRPRRERPRVGSTLTNGIAISALAAAKARMSSFVRCGRPGQVLVDGKDDARHLARAIVVGEGLRRRGPRRWRRSTSVPRRPRRSAAHRARGARGRRWRRSHQPSWCRLISRDHVRRRVVGVQVVDERPAALEDRALVERSLVGDLSGVERRRFRQHDRAADARRAARGSWPRTWPAACAGSWRTPACPIDRRGRRPSRQGLDRASGTRRRRARRACRPRRGRARRSPRRARRARSA